MGSRQILMFATTFDPASAGVDIVGTIRPGLWAKFLPELGWTPTVISAGERTSQTEDGLAVRYVPASSAVSRVKARGGVSIGADQRSDASRAREGVASARLQRLGRELASLAPDHFAWALRASKMGVAIAKRKHVEMVFSTSPSPAAHLAAWIVATQCSVPWVAELRDLWALRPVGAGTPRARRMPDRVAERLLFKRASALVTVSNDLAERLREAHPNVAVHAIPTGYDPALVAPAGTQLDSVFRLLHAGRLKGPQSSLPLLRPLADAFDSGEIDRSRTRVDILSMGTLPSRDRHFISDRGLDDVVAVEGTVPRSEVIQRERGAQVLLHFRWDDPMEPGIVTGKLFEYLAARRPILSTGRYDDEVGEVIRGTGAGLASSSERDTREYLVDAYREFSAAGQVPYRGEFRGLEQFSASVSAATLARVLDSAVLS